MRQIVLDALAKAARQDPTILIHLLTVHTESGVHRPHPVTGRTPVDDSLDYLVTALQRDGIADDDLSSEISFNDHQYIVALADMGFRFPDKRPNLNRRHLAPTHSWGSDMRLSQLAIVSVLLVFFGAFVMNAAGLKGTNRMDRLVPFSNVLRLTEIAALVMALAIWRDSSRFLYQISRLRMSTVLGIMIRSRSGVVITASALVGIATVIGLSHYAMWAQELHASQHVILVSLFLLVWQLRPPVCLLLGASGPGKTETLIKPVWLAFAPFRIVHLLSAPLARGGSHSIRAWGEDWRRQVDDAAQTAAFVVVDTRHDTPHVREEVVRWGPLSQKNKVVLYVVSDTGASPILSSLQTEANRDDIVDESSLEDILRRLRMTRNA